MLAASRPASSLSQLPEIGRKTAGLRCNKQCGGSEHRVFCYVGAAKKQKNVYMKTALVRIGSKEKNKKRAVAGTDEQSMRCNDVFSV